VGNRAIQVIGLGVGSLFPRPCERESEFSVLMLFVGGKRAAPHFQDIGSRRECLGVECVR